MENPQVWQDTPRGRGVVMRVSAGGEWQWVRSVGLTGPATVPTSGGSQPVPSVITSISLDPQTNHLLVSGSYVRGLSFPTISGAERFGISNPQKGTSNATPTGWFGSLPRDGSRWYWAVSLGGSGTTTAARITSDSGSRYFIAGEIRGMGFVGTGSGQTAIHSTATGTDGVQRIYESRLAVNGNLTNNGSTQAIPSWAFQLNLQNATVTSTALDALRGRIYLSATRADTEFHAYMVESDSLTGSPSATVVHESRRPSNPAQDRADAYAVRVSSQGRVYLAGGFIESLQFTGTNGSVSATITNPTGTSLPALDESYIAEFVSYAGGGTLSRRASSSKSRDMNTPNNPYVISMSDCAPSSSSGKHHDGHEHATCVSNQDGNSCGIPAAPKSPKEQHYSNYNQHCHRYRNSHREEGYACPDSARYRHCEDYKQLIVIGDGSSPTTPPPTVPGAATLPILGVAKTSGIAGGAPVIVIVQGVCQTSSSSSTLTSFIPGQRYYSAGNGQMTTVNTGAFIGIGLNTLEILLRPSE